ncbi:uncharacterized protein F4807DRAFT_462941 [Annulohypoxylon truncatum]|uniref:uncharacterized protein n=1 Tax=Annulohypoxylon truncatum TaxID=327061 RepID=UPI0020080C1F|nr:uncharacterized protein F4807DRAFT_462941 [Annulohypoxylon truncatum]KAI1207212.1 hypothetical protein F4807DRAFT_462941 [Annulohypoxylon truncatum]
MASNGVSEGSPRISTSTPTDEPSKIPPEEDESEWEYEYSTTETETFYVTLDLSKADFTSRDASTVNRPGYRGGEKVERAKMYLNRRMSFGNNNNNNNNNNIDLSSDSNSDLDGEEEIPQLPKPKDPPQPAPEPKGDAGEEFDDDDHQVQIMELHSQNPIISYKGRIYSGVWSANVGTEILLTRRDEDAPVPALRHLDHDVELLAASSARVTVREVNLRPKDEALERRRNALLPRERSALSSLVPPAERWSTRERIDQGNFLARLIALKKERGETDEVTVIAKGVERTTGGGKAERHGMGKQGHRGKFNLPHGRGPRRAKGSGILRTLAIHENGGEGEGEIEGMLEGGGSGVSTPTPRRWDDLGGQTGGEGDEGEEEEEGGEGEYDEVMIMDDLDEEGENEDESNEDGSEEDEDSDSSGSGSGDSAEGMDLDEI